jgi:uncharacterized surface protein with fasciclin (FAS1) repeats
VGTVQSFRGIRFGEMISTRLNDAAAAEYLGEKYRKFISLLGQNKKLSHLVSTSTADQPLTIFAPSSEAFAKLDRGVVGKLRDPRNGEVLDKVTNYHVVQRHLKADEIFKAAAVVTMGGEVPVTKSKSGGFLGVGAKEDGGVALNGGRIETSVEVGNCIIHQVDTLINPYLLYRFLDAVRLPGT